MKAYVINLRDSIDRRESIEGQLRQLKIDYEIVDAVNGSLLSDEDIREKADMEEVEKYPDWLNKNAIATSLSHMSVYRKICSSDNDWHLILEDDVILNKNILSIFHHIKKNSEIYKGRVILLYALVHEGKIQLSKNDSVQCQGFSTYKILNREELGGAGAYIVHKDTACLFLQKIDRIKVAADSWYFFYQQGIVKQINCVYPFAAEPGLFESTIGYVDKKTLSYKIKHFIERNKVPVLYHLLRKKRKAVWEKTSKVSIV